MFPRLPIKEPSWGVDKGGTLCLWGVASPQSFLCFALYSPTVNLFPCPLQIPASPLLYVLQRLIAARVSFGVILCSLPLFPLSSACCHPMHQPPPDNDVLIMRLLGQQIALQSHSHAVENCCCLGAPTLLCVSGRLTLASCWEWRSGTRAGALSPSP